MKYLIFLLFLSFGFFVKAQQSKQVYDPNAVSRDVSDFTSLSIKGPFTVFYSKGPECSIAISANNKDLRDKIETTSFGTQLSVKITARGVDGFFKNQDLRIYLSAPSLQRIEASGAVDFVIVDQLNSEDLSLNFSGSSDIKGNIDANRIKAVFSGASDMKVSGSAAEANIIVSGASVCDASNFKVEEADIKAIGASTIRIQVKATLKAVASGTSKIFYSGDPGRIDRSSSGASIIKNL